MKKIMKKRHGKELWMRMCSGMVIAAVLLGGCGGNNSAANKAATEGIAEGTYAGATAGRGSAACGYGAAYRRLESGRGT